VKIALCIPPSAFLIDDRVFPFLGPLQVAAVARAHGHDVKVIDLPGYRRRHPEDLAPSFENVLEEAKTQLAASLDGDEGLVGFYSLDAQKKHVLALVPTARQAAPKASLAVGGPTANTAPESLTTDFDYVIVSDQGGGGGEPGFLELLDRIRLRKVSLVDSKIIKASSRLGVQWENDRWPLPARDLIDLNDYRYFLKGERCTSIVSATGCPFACTYCSHWGGYRQLEAKSAKKVREELDSIRSAYGWRAVMAYDDEINLRPDFTTEFLPMMKDSGFIWRAFFKGGRNMTRPEVFEQMAGSGCVELCTGAETADPAMLKAIKKGATLEDNTAFVELCVKNGIGPKVFTQVGLPGETPETIEKLRAWLVAMAERGLKDADVTITTPGPGTPIYDHPEHHNIHFDKSDIAAGANYKGIPGEYVSHVWHDGLTPADLVAARQYVEDSFRKAAGLRPLLAKDDG
jgi:anaerobic magnesium-protoporphyrin IX monomethyl ester cyclase